MWGVPPSPDLTHYPLREDTMKPYGKDTRQWGLYTWVQDGRYLKTKPHKIYQTEKAADKAARKHYESNPDDGWVARPYYPPDS